MEFEDANTGLNKRNNKQLMKTKLKKEISGASDPHMVEA